MYLFVSLSPTVSVSLQGFWWTGQVSTSTSSWPAAPSWPPPQCSSLFLSAYWTKKRGTLRSPLSRARCLSKAGRPSAWLQAASTAACPQRATKTRPQPTGPSTSPASKTSGIFSQLGSKVCDSTPGLLSRAHFTAITDCATHPRCCSFLISRTESQSMNADELQDM